LGQHADVSTGAIDSPSVEIGRIEALGQ